MQLAIRPEAGYLSVEATGRFSLKQAERTFLEMLEAMGTQKRSKALFDGRKITGNPETLERFFYGKFAAQAVASFVGREGISPKFAYVLKEPVLDPTRFGETVAVNRGMDVRAFDSLEEALQWLGARPTTKPVRSRDPSQRST